jgi:hypothetical protein
MTIVKAIGKYSWDNLIFRIGFICYLLFVGKLFVGKLFVGKLFVFPLACCCWVGILFIGVNLRIKLLINLGSSKGLAPPLSLLKRGTLRTLPVPPEGKQFRVAFLRGVRGERVLILKQQTGTKFSLKLTPMDSIPLLQWGQTPAVEYFP